MDHEMTDAGHDGHHPSSPPRFMHPLQCPASFANPPQLSSLHNHQSIFPPFDPHPPSLSPHWQDASHSQQQQQQQRLQLPVPTRSLGGMPQQPHAHMYHLHHPASAVPNPLAHGSASLAMPPSAGSAHLCPPLPPMGALAPPNAPRQPYQQTSYLPQPVGSQFSGQLPPIRNFGPHYPQQGLFNTSVPYSNYNESPMSPDGSQGFQHLGGPFVHGGAPPRTAAAASAGSTGQTPGNFAVPPIVGGHGSSSAAPDWSATTYNPRTNNGQRLQALGSHQRTPESSPPRVSRPPSLTQPHNVSLGAPQRLFRSHYYDSGFADQRLPPPLRPQQQQQPQQPSPTSPASQDYHQSQSQPTTQRSLSPPQGPVTSSVSTSSGSPLNNAHSRRHTSFRHLSATNSTVGGSNNSNGGSGSNPIAHGGPSPPNLTPNRRALSARSRGGLSSGIMNNSPSGNRNSINGGVSMPPRRRAEAHRHTHTGSPPSDSGGGPAEWTDPDDDDLAWGRAGGPSEDEAMRYLGNYLGQSPLAQTVMHGNHADQMRAMQLIRGRISMRQVASKTTMAALQNVDKETLGEDDRTCCICYNDYGDPSPEGEVESPIRLPWCKHVFGDRCIKKWFNEADNCPYCRAKVPSESRFTSQSLPLSILEALQFQYSNVRARQRQRRTPQDTFMDEVFPFGDPQLLTPPAPRAHQELGSVPPFHWPNGGSPPARNAQSAGSAPESSSRTNPLETAGGRRHNRDSLDFGALQDWNDNDSAGSDADSHA